MGTGSSKKKARKAERRRDKRLKASLSYLPDPSGSIPEGVAVSPALPDTLSYLDGDNYQLVFERYNSKMCQLDTLQSGSAKALVHKFNEITRVNDRTIGSTNLVRDKVLNTGAYSPLFRNIEPDVDMVEIEFANSGRIMCYFINQYQVKDRYCNYCCIIAVLTKHLKV